MHDDLAAALLVLPSKPRETFVTEPAAFSNLGRLEVTALGDEMNEAARIEAVASAGQILASKNLVERLTPEDAESLGLDPARMHDESISSLSTDSKTVRDAGLRFQA